MKKPRKRPTQRPPRALTRQERLILAFACVVLAIIICTAWLTAALMSGSSETEVARLVDEHLAAVQAGEAATVTQLKGQVEDAGTQIATLQREHGKLRKQVGGLTTWRNGAGKRLEHLEKAVTALQKADREEPAPRPKPHRWWKPWE